MNASAAPNPLLSVTDAAVRLRMVREAGYLDFIAVLNDVEAGERYRVCLDVSAVSHLGTTEFRVLRIFAERFEQHDGFLRLENASAKLAALFRSYGCDQLLAGTAGQVPFTRDGVDSVCLPEPSGSLSGAPGP
jgi:anti-anti-sigma regulatory factor